VAAKKDRQRRLAREHFERQQAQRVRRRHRQRQGAAIGGAIAVVAALAVGGYFLFAGGGGKTSASASSNTPSASPAAAPAAAAQATGPASRCSYTPGGSAARNVGLPPATPAAGLATGTARYTATIRTNLGNIVVNLAAGKATCTVNSFVYLAQKAFFNSTKCHRLVTSGIYVLQCGDPSGTGTGGPGYAFANEVSGDSTSASATYPAGTLAMAHSSQPDSNGSQFFVVYQTTKLPRDYTPFGTVTNGLDIVKNMATAGTDNANGPGDGHPKQNIVIESVTITS
jgi:peptidyl-prolyl cis-trans isomerase B (cyclophilin B)